MQRNPATGAKEGLPVINFFLPDEFKDKSVNEALRGQILIASGLFGAALLTPFMVWRAMLQGIDHPLIIGLCLCWLLFLFVPVFYRVNGSVVNAGFMLSTTATIQLAFFAFFDGGFASTAVAWFPIIPLLGVFFSGLRIGVVIGAALVVYALVLGYWHLAGIVPPTPLRGEDHWMHHTANTAFVVTVFLTLAIVYINWQESLKEDLRAASRAKSEFLSGVSHELRTPLNAIMGYSELLSKNYLGELTQEQSEVMEHIETSSEHLLSIVDNLLDIARIESGRLELKPSPVSVPSLINDVITMHRTQADQAGCELIADCMPDLMSSCFYLDEVKIRQVLLNLASNALIHSPPGGVITIRADLADGLLSLQVLDQGRGVPEEYREQIFDRFFQVYQASDNKDTGTGLGLAISRYLIEMHKGRIYCDDNPCGQGARFVVEIPASAKKLEQAA